MKKILIITGSRATYGLYRPIIVGMLKSKVIKPQILVTGMHTLKEYGLTIDEIKADHFPIVCVVEIMNEDDMLTVLSKEIMGINKFCVRCRPDAIMVLGDTDHMFAGAIVGGHLKIPVFHIAGGDITGRVVDEAIRHSITKFSHLHFTSTEKSRSRVLRLGEDKWRVHNVGAPGLAGLKKLKFRSRLELARPLGLDPDKKWFLVLQHSTPLDNVPFEDQIRPLLESVAELEAEKIVVYPNSDSGSQIIVQEILKNAERPDFHIFKTLQRLDYLSLLNCANLLIGNSSSGIVESTFFCLPTINIGNRQGNRETGANVIYCGYSKAEISEAIKKAISTPFKQKCLKAKSPYGDGSVAVKIVKIIERQIDNPNLLIKKDLPILD